MVTAQTSFRPAANHRGHDSEGGGMRYLEWVHDPDPGRCVFLGIKRAA